MPAEHETITGTALVPVHAPSVAPFTDDDLIREGDAAAERVGARMREEILPMARGLAAAKRKYTATQAFHAWLKGSRGYSQLELGDSDRAALIRIGKALDRHEPEIIEFLADHPRLSSPQTIWTGIAAKLGLVAGDANDVDADDDDVGDIAPDIKLQQAREHAQVMNSLWDLAQQSKAKAPSEAGGAGGDADDDAPAPKHAPTVGASCYLSNSKKRSPRGKDPSEPVRPRASGAKRKVAAPTDATTGSEAPDDPWNSGDRFDLVLVTPTADDVRHLRDAQPDWLKCCLPLHRVVEDDVAVVVDTTIRHLPVIADVLLRLFGFTPGKRPRVLMVQRPQAPDVTDARVLVVIENGVKFSAPEGWPDDAHDQVQLARQLYTEASRSLLVFGSTQAEGWQCCGWAKSPSVR